MSNLTCKTSRDFYDTYVNLSATHGFRFSESNLSMLGIKNVQTLRDMFASDPNLNQIPLATVDNVSAWICRRAGLSLSQGCCLVKHSLIYHVLNATPEFTD